MEGTAASPGIAIGSAFLLFGKSGQATGANLGADDRDIELNRFYQALEEALDDIKMLQQKVQEKIGKKEAHIFSFQEDIIADEQFAEKVAGFIKNEDLPAEKAVQRVIRQYAAELADSEETYIKVSENDIKDIGERLINLLQGQDIKLDVSQNNIIIVAKELSPSQIARLDTKKVLGLVAAEGSSTSHAAILASSLGLPAGRASKCNGKDAGQKFDRHHNKIYPAPVFIVGFYDRISTVAGRFRSKGIGQPAAHKEAKNRHDINQIGLSHPGKQINSQVQRSGKYNCCSSYHQSHQHGYPGPLGYIFQ